MTSIASGEGAPPHVVIAGGGIGGLCLAQGLTRSGIGAAVYERDSRADSRPQGYRISLKETGVSALRDCLPPHLFELAAATSLRQPTRMIFTDEQLNQKFA